MTAQLSLVQDNVNKALGDFLTGILPTGIPIIVGQTNRVAEPQADDFVVMWPIRRTRLTTNIDKYVDCKFEGSIANNILIVTSVDYGVISVGRQVFGVGVLANTVILGLGTGTGGVGTYSVSNTQTLSSQVLACGSAQLLNETMATMQVDVHGSNSADNAEIICTAFRDTYAVEQFAAQPYDVWPLYADDARQIPFIDESDQYEERWIVEVSLQINPVLYLSQQFADIVTVKLIEVDTIKTQPVIVGELDFSKPKNSGWFVTGTL